jgi:hypothetical protein
MRRIFFEIFKLQGMKLSELFSNTDQDIKENILRLVNEHKRIDIFTSRLKSRTWILYFNSIAYSNPFITSDHPVCYLNMKTKIVGFDDSEALGIDTVVYYPVTPKILIAIFPSHLVGNTIKIADGWKVNVGEVEFIETMNELQYVQCDKQIYSCKKIIL